VEAFSTPSMTPLAGSAHNMHACDVSRIVVDICSRHNRSEFS